MLVVLLRQQLFGLESQLVFEGRRILQLEPVGFLRSKSAAVIFSSPMVRTTVSGGT
jgi:hypothetical protein